MALPLLKTMEHGSRKPLTLIAAGVISLAVAMLLVPSNSALALCVIAGLWGGYAFLRIWLARRHQPAAVAVTPSNYLDRDRSTGLAGRTELTAALKREIARSQRLGHKSALFVLDTRIVNFRPAKNGAKAPSPASYVARVLTEQGRATDMVCRVDLTRFAVLLADASEEGTRVYEERIRTSLSAAPYAENDDGSGIWVRGWGGWAAWEPEMTRPAHFLMAALAHMEEQRHLYETEQLAFGGRALAS